MITESLAPLSSNRSQSDDPTAVKTDKLRRVAAEFESVFLAQVLREATQGLTDAGKADDSFAGMLQDEYAKLIGRNGGIGVAEMIYREMLKMQEAP